MDEQNITFTTNSGERFRYRAVAVIIEDGCVLMATNAASGYYYTIGGAVHLGETAMQCAEREAFEETGVHFKAERLLFVHENFFVDHSKSLLNGYRSHEISLYYLMESRGTKLLPQHKSKCIDGDEYVEWIPICEYSNKHAYPSFFATELADLSDTVKHFVTED